LNQKIVEESTLGIVLKDNVALDHGFTILNQVATSVNESWQPVLGEQATIQNVYNQITYYLLQKHLLFC
jgi:hypothetical protein